MGFNVKKKKLRNNCFYCKKKINYIDYKEIELLKKFTSPTGQILPRRITRTCSKHQRKVALAIKRCREVAFIQFLIG